ncbi:MAG: hypothetical protein KGI45_01555 [Patescibacteria group bacterium]|nr:hypothetical protein [Patescibacteria group bacterium]MDE1940833.1 hypothetical protein [Patescibacteria group bacterium]MDE1966743.1 hypothetical protein [Patescibacteria group bacterium]
MSSKLQVILEPGIAQKLQFAINRTDGTYEDVEYLSTGDNFRAVTLLRTGKAKLVEVSENGSEGAVIPTAPTPAEWTVDGDGNIHFTVTSNGLTPEQWERHLESRGFRLSDYARNVLRRASEAATNGVAYHIVVRPGSKISSRDRITKKIRAHATEKGWKTPHWEVACLIRDTFTDEQLEKMGLWWIVTMHGPITDSGGDPNLLHSFRGGGGRWLVADCGRPDDEWGDRGGFAFVVPQVSPQN